MTEFNIKNQTRSMKLLLRIANRYAFTATLIFITIFFKFIKIIYSISLILLK